MVPQESSPELSAPISTGTGSGVNCALSKVSHREPTILRDLRQEVMHPVLPNLYLPHLYSQLGSQPLTLLVAELHLQPVSLMSRRSDMGTLDSSTRPHRATHAVVNVLGRDMSSLHASSF